MQRAVYCTASMTTQGAGFTCEQVRHYDHIMTEVKTSLMMYCARLYVYTVTYHYHDTVYIVRRLHSSAWWTVISPNVPE